MARTANQEKKVRLNLDLPKRTRERLETMRVQTNADSLTEVIRRSLEIYEAVLEASKNGTLIIRLPDGTERQIIII